MNVSEIKKALMFDVDYIFNILENKKYQRIINEKGIYATSYLICKFTNDLNDYFSKKYKNKKQKIMCELENLSKIDRKTAVILAKKYECTPKHVRKTIKEYKAKNK